MYVFSAYPPPTQLHTTDDNRFIMFHFISAKRIITFSVVFFLSANTCLQPLYGVSDTLSRNNKPTDNPEYAYKVTGFTVTYENKSLEQENYIFVWDFGDGTVSNVQSTVEHTYETMGYFQTCLSVKTPEGITVEKQCKYVEVIDPNLCESNWEPVCGCDNQTYINECFAANYYGVYYWESGPCTNIDYTLNSDFSYDRHALTVVFINTSVGNFDDYVWNFGDGNSSENRNPTHRYQAAGTYRVCLKVSSLVTTLEREICYDVEICDSPIPTDMPDVPVDDSKLPARTP